MKNHSIHTADVVGPNNSSSTQLVIVTEGRPVTTTLAIAEGTCNSHEAVIKLVRRYSSDMKEFGLVRFEIRPREQGKHGGADTEYALLNEQQSTLLLTYMRNTETVRGFKKRLVKAFFKMAQALSQRTEPVIDWNHPGQLRGLLIQATEQIEKRDETIALMSPKADAYDRLSGADGSVCITNAAKDLKIRPKDLFQYLQAHHWIYKRIGSAHFVAYQDKLQSGYLEHKVTTVSRSDGSEKTVEQVRITAKGLTRLANLLAKRNSHSLTAEGGRAHG